MPLVKNIVHQYEVNPLACGQAVLSMITGIDVKEIIKLVGTDKETTLKDMKRILSCFKISFDEERRQAFSVSDLPDIALLSLETPRCWHWSLYCKGKFYDPEHGVLSDFPECKRKYFWKICEE